MRHSSVLALLATSALILTASTGVATAAPAPAPPSHRFTTPCATSTPGGMSCQAIRNDTISASGGVVPNAKPSATTTPNGYGPSSLQSAYRLPSSTAGSGQVVAIVDAYDDPNAEADMATYRSTYGLPACTTANGCFRKVGQSGTSTLPAADGGWAQEISLDLDMVSATCPLCGILLVEATSPTTANLGTAVNTAARLGAKAISNSYGGSESSSDPTYDSQYYNHPGVMITASSGDGGYGVEYPAASKYVTAVGGTSLSTSTNARGWTESAWSGAGSGCSAYDTKPSWQADTGCSKRTVADVSAVADPNTGVAVYDSYAYQGTSGWLVFGGTSASAPIIASVYALAGNAATLTYGSYPYSHTGSLNPVTSGSNGTCGGSYLCTAGPGYDGPTGLGTPNGTGAF